MQSRIMKYAVAAAVIIAAVWALNTLEWGGGVAWAKVVKNVENVKAFVHRMKMTVQRSEGSHDVDMTFYRSTEYGTRRDSFYNEELISRLYVGKGEDRSVELLPTQQKYIKAVFTEEQLKEITEKNDPKAIVKEFMCCNQYTELGRKTINGIEVEGIEVDNEQFGATLFERGKGRLWAAVDTELPVLIELEGTSAGGTVQISLTLDGFDWTPGLQAKDFEPNIPPDYTMMAEVDLSGSIEAVIKGLRGFTQITQGKYPSNLDLMTAGKEVAEAYGAMRQSQGRDDQDPPTQEEMENMLTIQGACLFYGKLTKEDKDVAYYGDQVTPEDADKVLMRWKISDEQYRVIFGDLSTRDVGKDELAQLEGQTLKQ